MVEGKKHANAKLLFVKIEVCPYIDCQGTDTLYQQHLYNQHFYKKQLNEISNFAKKYLAQ